MSKDMLEIIFATHASIRSVAMLHTSAGHSNNCFIFTSPPNSIYIYCTVPTVCFLVSNQLSGALLADRTLAPKPVPAFGVLGPAALVKDVAAAKKA